MQKDGRKLALDTRALPQEVLTAQEKNILGGINDLLRNIQDEYRQSKHEQTRATVSPWANPRSNSRNNVIMLDGGRGTGKTSLLLTLLDGWNQPEKFQSIEQQVQFAGMTEVVRALHPIDFDPLPPELPIYNWIIQAFNPLVQMVSGPRRAKFLEPQEHDQLGDTLAGQYRKLTHAAAVGWTTGLLRQSMGEDAGEYLIWQEEQQFRWQNLETEWRTFIEKLCLELGDRSSTDLDQRLPHDAVIVLPIDDLDLQVERTRELLLAIRVLRHERLAYILTGDSEGTELALQSSFYREFLHGIPTIAEEFQDKIKEFTNTLAPQVRKKSIPTSQTFEITGQSIGDAMSWTPYPEGDTLGTLLNKFWNKHGRARRRSIEVEEICTFLESRGTYVEQNLLTFRSLQNFFDRWSNEANLVYDNGLIGISEFLKVAISDPKEESLLVSDPTAESRIEISSSPGVYAPIARPAGTAINGRKQIEIKWAIQLDFVRRDRGDDNNTEVIFQSASPGHLLALDLVAWEPSTFEIVNDLRLADRTLGLIWTEITVGGEMSVVPWPMREIPTSPLGWIQQCRRFNEILSNFSPSPLHFGNPTVEQLVMAWCVYVSEKTVELSMPLQHYLKSLSDEVTSVLTALGSDLLGLPSALRDDFRKSLGSGHDWDLHVKRYPVDQAKKSLEMLAFAPADRGR